MSLTANIISLTDEQVARNVVRGLVQKGDWRQIERIARRLGSGFADLPEVVQAATAAIALRDEKAARRAAPRHVPFRPGPVVLSGPAAAGKRGGGREAPPLPPTPSKKTNVGFWSKGASVAKTAPANEKDGKKKKKGKGKK